MNELFIHVAECVRYHGQVRGTKGAWLGVEWDDPTRGKHDGTHDGYKYFECISKASHAASFVRPTRPSDSPRSFVEALKLKYASDMSPPTEATSELDNHNPKQPDDAVIRISGKEVEEVGFEKIRKRLADLPELRVIILDGLCIHRFVTDLDRRAWESWSIEGREDPLNFEGRLLDIRQACPQVTELDLGRNLFEEWLEIASICEQSIHLKSLRCDGNRFRDVKVTDQQRRYFEHKFGTVESLSLAETLLSWEDLCSVAQMFTSITSLVASSNQIQYLVASKLPETLTTITLEGNQFRNLSDVSSLRDLPFLRKLVLRNNKISAISPNSSSEPPVFQTSLQELDLSRNEISSWSFIDSLPSTLPGLTALRVSGNPLYHSLRSPDGKTLTADDGYILTIARLPHLATLNYSPVSAKDRLNAETYYLSQIALEISLLPAGTSDTAVTALHPRWAGLCAEYGEPAIAGRRAAAAADPDSLSARLLRLRLKVGSSAASLLGAEARPNGADAQGTTVLDVPKRYSVYTVQGLVGRRLGLAPPTVRLIWETGEQDVVAAREEGDGEPWDSDVDDDAEMVVERVNAPEQLREVELVPGTRAISTWVEGDDVVIRVEVA